MQLRDPGLLISIIGISGRKLTQYGRRLGSPGISVYPQVPKLQALNQQVDTYSVATSTEGLLNIRKYWDSHCTTLVKLPAIALLDTSSYPKGLSDSDFVQLLGRITDLQEWQIWDLWDTLDIHSCGYIGCPEFTLVIVLMCAGLSQQQMAAVHTFHGSICRVFAGAHVFSPVAGIMQCCLLMTLPTSCLMTAIRHLNKSMQHIPACSSGDAAACGSTGDSSRHRDMKAAVRRELHGTEVAPSTSQGSAGPTGKDSSEDSSKQSSSAHVAAGPKTPSGSSNRVLPEVAGDSQERAGLAACALERSDNRGATAALTQAVQLLLYIAIRLAQGDLTVLHGGVEASHSVDGSRPLPRSSSSSSSSIDDTRGAWQSRCLCCVIS